MNNLKKLLLVFATVFFCIGKLSAQSDDIDNDKATYGYVKDIKKINRHYFITYDAVIVKHNSATGEVKIINQNKKLRTLILSVEPSILSADCQKISAEELLKNKSKHLKLKNKYAVPIIEIDNGIIMAINFGCYG